MYLTFLLLTLQVLITTASHFYGGSMTFNSRRNFDGSYKVELRFKTAFHHCTSYDNWPCWSGDCGFVDSYEIGETDSSVNGGNWCQSEAVVTRTVSTNNPFELVNQACCWIYNTVTTDGAWRLLTHIDLGVRSDTSEPNRSPITTTLPFLRVPQNCPRRFNLLAFDPDGDHVRCRYGLGYNDECGICNQPAGFTLDQNECSLSYDYTWLPGVYSFELILEDFPMHMITLSYTNQPSVTKDPVSFNRGRRSVNIGYETSTTTNAMTTTTYAPTTTAGVPCTTTDAPQTIKDVLTISTIAQTTITVAPTTNTVALCITPDPPTTTTDPPTTLAQAPTTTTTAPSTTTDPTLPLSKIPLQFSLQVDGPALSCTEGEYLPQFLHPTPHHGEHLQAHVNEELEIRINAFAYISSITDVIISGPLYSTKHKATTGEYVINWTPIIENYGQHFPFCFIAEGQYGSNIYQSEMMCVIVKVEDRAQSTTTTSTAQPTTTTTTAQPTTTTTKSEPTTTTSEPTTTTSQPTTTTSQPTTTTSQPPTTTTTSQSTTTTSQPTTTTTTSQSTTTTSQPTTTTTTSQPTTTTSQSTTTTSQPTTTTTTSQPTTTTSESTTTTSEPTTTTTEPTTTTSQPTTTTSQPTTTTSESTTTTSEPTTTTSQPTTTTSESTTTTSEPTTTTSEPTTTTSQPTTTTSESTTTTSQPTTTTSEPTTTTSQPTTTTSESTTTTSEPTTTTTTSEPTTSQPTTSQPTTTTTTSQPTTTTSQPTTTTTTSQPTTTTTTSQPTTTTTTSQPTTTTSQPTTTTSQPTTTKSQPTTTTTTSQPTTTTSTSQLTTTTQAPTTTETATPASQGPKAHVTCLQNSMSVAVEKSTIKKINNKHLRLIDPLCQPNSNETHVFITIHLNGCGTEMRETNDHLIFKNKIITYDDPRDIITRKHELEIEFLCKYQKRSNLTMEFDTRRPGINFTEIGFGSFSYEFEFYQSASFYSEIDATSYPLDYDLGEMIYMQIEPITPVQNTEIFLESCVATPYDNPNYPISYPIITNGCIVDETVQIFSNHQPYIEFGLEAFKFIGLHDQVFISCSIVICEANNPITRCSQGCTNITVSPPSHHHHKREAPIQTNSHFISQGPLRLRRASQVTVSQGVNLNLLVIAGCLLATVAMVCGVLVYRSRMSMVRYQPVPSYELSVRSA